MADSATYMAKTDEVVTLNISTETGKPISYRVRQEWFYPFIPCLKIESQIYWDDGEITEENDTTTNSYVFTHTYADVSTGVNVSSNMCFLQPGKYKINVTAFNLHSNELYGYNKFINNMTRCCLSINRWKYTLIIFRTLLIQKPVENWKLEVFFSFQSLWQRSSSTSYRRHTAGSIRMEATLLSLSIQTIRSVPQRQT